MVHVISRGQLVLGLSVLDVIYWSLVSRRDLFHTKLWVVLDQPKQDVNIIRFFRRYTLGKGVWGETLDYDVASALGKAGLSHLLVVNSSGISKQLR